MIRDQQAEIDKLKQELQNRDAAEQELRQKHEGAMDAIAKLNARLISTELGGTPKPTLSMEEIVTAVKQEVKKASNADADASMPSSMISVGVLPLGWTYPVQGRQNVSNIITSKERRTRSAHRRRLWANASLETNGA
jgi:hypothetical protein